MLCVHVHAFAYPALTLTQLGNPTYWLILLAYENGDCPAISVPQNGSVAKEAPNLLKVYTEGFRVLLLNGTVIGCKSINLYPIV